MREATFVSRSAEETRAIGGRLAPFLAPGDVVVLSGDLGAGKTCLVQGIARGLGVVGRVTSPSFVLVREYRGRIPILHIDVYRLGNLQELTDLGYDEFLDSSWVVLIEWGDAVAAMLPDHYLEIEIRGAAEAERHIAMRARGRRWGAILDRALAAEA